MSSGWTKVVVGYDGGEESKDALRLARELAVAADAELHVAVVLPRGEAPFEEAFVRGGITESLNAQIIESATAALEEFEFKPASLDGGLGGRSAARALYEYAEEQGAEAIVVGSTHRGKVGRVLPGSVGESLLHGAPCAVAVAPRGYARGEHAPVGLIGLGYDGSDEAKLALDEAVRLADALDAKVRVITVVPGITLVAIQAPQRDSIYRELRQRYSDILEEGVRALGDKAAGEGVLGEGNPAFVLAEQSVDLDLLVIGSRGYGPVRGALAGATSAATMRSAPCPVLITPRSSAAR